MRAYFGEPYPSRDRPAAVFEGLKEVSVPVGQECLDCNEPIAAGDRGFLLPVVRPRAPILRPTHFECHLRSVMGSVTHLEHRCTCFGGKDEDEYPSRRLSALATLQWLEARGWPRL